MLLVTSKGDKPGLMGMISTILGKYGINIEAVSLGVERPGGRSVVIFNLDRSISAEMIDRIVSLDGISQAVRVDLH